MQSRSRVRLSATPWTAACQASLSIADPQSLLKLISIELVMASSHLILCRPLLLLPSLFPSIRVFPNGPVLHIRSPSYSVFLAVFDTADQFFLVGKKKKILFNHLASVCCRLAFSFDLSINFFTLPCWLFLLCS